MKTTTRGLSLAEMTRHSEDAARLLRVLANPHRLRVLCALSDGELPVGELNARVDLSQSALSQHLAVLREDGVVATRRDGQTIHYRLKDGPAVAIVRTLQDLYCGPGGK